MLRKINTKDLAIGMHVVLPSSWLDHPFLRNRFTISSGDEIRKIREAGFSEVMVDTAKGFPFHSTEAVGHGDASFVPPEEWKPETLVPAELRSAIGNEALPSREKARIVYQATLEMVRRLFRDPKASHIAEARKGIAEVVDLIVADDETAFNLLRITSHDFYTYTHSVNVGVLCVLLSKVLFGGRGEHDMRELGIGYFLHDLGKVRIDPAIINKAGRLTEDEMKKMRAHPYQGYKILAEAGHLTEECNVILMQHHEREDGMGYPRGLSGDEIHLHARIACIVDVYDALTAERSYKQRLNSFEALKLMRAEMLDHFHRDVFEQFVLLFSRRGKG